jgi:thiol-disulfide isomerase/thioredoxin
MMQRSKVLLVSLLILFIFSTGASSNVSSSGVAAQTSDQPLILNFFYAHGCTYCEAAYGYLQDLKETYPTLEIHGFDVYLDPGDRSLYYRVLDHLGRSPQGMPTIIIGKHVWVGLQNIYQQEIVSALNTCLSETCVDIPRIINSDSALPTITDTSQSIPSPPLWNCSSSAESP